MLGLRRLTSSGADYYLSDLAGELPLDTCGGPVWMGRQAEELGLVGPVDPRHLHDALEGRHPASGREVRARRTTVSGLDLTFSAPKSVSVLFALGGEDMARQMVECQREAVAGALGYVESHAVSARRVAGGQRAVISPGAVVAAAFTHGVNRNLDPHLHTHVILPNLVQGPDGRWSAMDLRGLSAHRAAAGALYEAHLRHAVARRAMVGWDVSPSGAMEVRGLSPLLRAEFSSRTADIKRHMHEWGAHSSRGARVAWAVTRPEKTGGLAYAQLSAEWQRRAGQWDVDVSHAAGRVPPGVDRLNEHRYHGALTLAPDGAARRRDVSAAFAVSAIAGADTATVEQLTDMWHPAVATGREVGVFETAHPLRAVVPGADLLRILGPRPIGLAPHRVWRDAARSIGQFREHWGDAATREACGTVAKDRAPVPTDRLIAHLRLAREVGEARQRLGWREPRSVELDRGR